MTLFKEKVATNPDITSTISLEDACLKITDGKHGDCESEENSGYFFVSVKDISNGCIDFKNARQITKADFLEAHKRTNLEVGDILFTNSGTLGRMCLVSNTEYVNRTTFQKSVAILKPNKSIISPEFLFLSLAYYKNNLIEFAHGSAQKNLLLSDMRIFEIKLPHTPLMETLDKLLQPLFRQIEQNNNEIISLKALAEILLSELVTSSR